ncbi:cadherin-24 isoform X2 [Malaclemys terrapin pileata]|uniref:cadherin-24 isoform X2 n=1 Tax=Malaclemys terrapin pileata TaxID=2991368 RepID=UPI0023A8DAF8|nr:cadherin-24 isoform X2 [Malaclemys terrapin pileata]
MPSVLGLLLAWLGGCGCAGRLGPPWPGSRGAPPQGWERPLLRSRRSWVWNQFFVIEEYAGPEPVLIGRLHSDVDRGEGRVKYVLTGEGAGTVFVIDERTGNVHVTKTLDREEKAQYTLLAQAVDRASNRPLEPPSEFIIKVQDINDNPPVFPDGPYHATVPEMSNVGTSVIQVTAHDADDPSYGNSAKLVYMVLEGLPFFSVDPQSDSYQFSVLETLPPGSPVGRLRAHDPDEGDNARLSYRLLDGDGPFAISTDPLGRDGILTISQPLDFERRQAYALRVEAANTRVDPLYIRQGPFKDVATVHVAVEDAAEPPAFARPSYQLGVPENSPPGTVVGKITASDLDTPSSTIRYSILPHSDPGRYFSISPQDGTLRTALPLDRETLAWHNLTVVATELDSPAQAAPVPVVVHALDVNDNVPELAPGTEPFICHGTVPGQLIQTIWALDRDEAGAGSRVTIHSPPGLGPSDLTVRDNEDGSAALLLRTPRLSPPGGPPLLVPLELVDGGHPPLTGTPTLTLSVCQCRPDGALRSCQPPLATGAAPGLSTAALLAILGCGASLLALAGLLARGRPKGGARMTPAEEGEVRENIISYDDEGGGEADTQAFDMAALQRPPPPGLPSGPPRLATCLAARLGRADADPRAPPYDSLQVYGYEGGGTPCGSLSPLGSSWGDSEGEGGDPGEWGPLFRTLAELYGGQEGPA